MSTRNLPLPTDTVHVRIESRQYRLFKIDLGEGVVRRKLWVGAAIVVPYWILISLLGASPLRHGGGIWFIMPPAVLVFFALRPDPGGRPRYTLWADRFRFQFRRLFPMIDGSVARLTPGRPFIVTARWTVVDLGQTRRLRRHLQRHESTGRAVPMAKVLDQQEVAA